MLRNHGRIDGIGKAKLAQIAEAPMLQKEWETQSVNGFILVFFA